MTTSLATPTTLTRAEKARARAKRWYNLHPDRVIARSIAWKKANPERARAFGRNAARRKAPIKICATEGCHNIVETLERQIKFCKKCSRFYRKTVWRGRQRVGITP